MIVKKVKDGYTHKCESCGNTWVVDTDKFMHNCRGVKTPMQLGDRTETLLKSIGITPDRYKEAKKLFGLSPTCNCASKKRWLNKVSTWAASIGK